jgi:hypothetical protein
MESTYKLIFDFKSSHPLKFWTFFILTTILVIFLFFSKRKKKNSVIQRNEVGETKTTKKNKDNSKNNKSDSIISSVETSKNLNEESKLLKSKKNNQKKLVDKAESIQSKIKAKSLEKLPKAKDETAKLSNQICFVNYDIKIDTSINLFPIVCFPIKGTVVRSFRLGNTKRRGFKEESFQISIEEFFGKDFLVSGNVRLNTGKETRPFEPDIAIIDESSSNLRIDIEIDEPYAGITRKPTHCKGDDINRNFYFTDRGWIVLRFSEYQVHLQEAECLKFIAEIIKLALPNYEIPIRLKKLPKVNIEDHWDIIQAQKWEKENYREKYLNHKFNFLEDQIETIERAINSQELKEEKFVKPTLIGKLDKKKTIGFNLENKHSRDSRIKFNSEYHNYFIDNLPASSVSTIISKFFPEFDPYSAARSLNPNHELFGVEIEEIVKIWDYKAKQAAFKGTFLHEQIEKFYLNQKYIITEEFHLFKSFMNENIHLEPFRTEWRIFDEEFSIAGTIDLISKNDNAHEMYDWKRSKNVINTITGEPKTNNQWQKGVGQLSDMDDTSYNRYCLQQSLYKYILEKNYDLNVSKMFLVVLYPEYHTYYKVEVPYLKEKVEYILKTL